MAAATSAQIKSRLANLLKIQEADLPSYWDEICTVAATFGDQECKGRLYARGFDADEVAGWDRLYEFTLDLGLWKAVTLGGAYSGFSAEVIASLDRRKELTEVLVFVSGEWVRPAMGAAGQVMSAGPRDGDTEGVFNWQPDQKSYGIDW